ncbi:hypothetical protein DL95DRAFT_393376 [Leptodontidium sp. 2 PMI_412]|nr:hypothetical protein DL95DRAFT_393376 [Leptodontidium sp. 2 PMI_412]
MDRVLHSRGGILLLFLYWLFFLSLPHDRGWSRFLFLDERLLSLFNCSWLWC